MKVYLVIETKSEDYHGSNDTVLDVYKNLVQAEEKVLELEKENNNYDIEYGVYTFPVI